jgi:hypothetical protein
MVRFPKQTPRYNGSAAAGKIPGIKTALRAKIIVRASKRLNIISKRVDIFI